VLICGDGRGALVVMKVNGRNVLTAWKGCLMIRFGPIEHYRPLMLAALRALSEFMARG
jgi:hypothetical protein